MITRTRIVAFLFACASATTTSLAQEAMFGQSATFVPREHLRIRPMMHYSSYGDSPSGAHQGITEWSLETEVAYGLNSNASLEFNFPITARRTETATGADSDSGFDDIDAMLKFRSFRIDTGPINTIRGAWLLGTEIPSGNDALSSDSFNPMAGYAVTWIRERHGGSFSAMYKLNTNDHDEGVAAGDSKADLFSLSGAYLYRVAPETYTAATPGAWFISAESELNLETNGDSQLLLGPGIMYEGRLWAFEAAVQLPVFQNLDHRPDLHVTVAFGFRVLF